MTQTGPHSLRKLIKLQADEEAAGIQLTMAALLARELDHCLATHVALRQVVNDEVERRTAVYAELWPKGPNGHDVSPRCAALKSVTNDLLNGWLR